jgi:hypothetical protein
MSQKVPIVLQNSQSAVRLIFRQNTKKRQSPIDVSSSAPPKSLVSSSPIDVVPRMTIRSTRLRPGEFFIGGAKRLLQQYLPLAEASRLCTHQECLGKTARPSALAVLKLMISSNFVRLFERKFAQ